MNKKEVTCAVLLGLGIIIMSISVLDIISICTSILNGLFNLKLPDVFFNSFIFRTFVVLIGGLIAIIGAVIYKRIDK